MSKVYEIVVNKIVKSLEEGVVPWQSPYTFEGHQNYISKHKYSGINALLLSIEMENQGYSIPLWLTYNQIKDKGWKLKKGSKSAMVVFFKRYYPKTKEDNDVIEEIVDTADENEETQNKPVYVLRYYKVYNIDCVETADGKSPVVNKGYGIETQAKVTLLNDYLNAEEIKIVSSTEGVSYYNPIRDEIALTPVKTLEGYVQVLSHEVVHSTGHSKRLARLPQGFIEKEEHSFEELIAEIGSAYLMYEMGYEPNYENTAAYIDGWAKYLKENKKTAIFKASRQAEKAVEYILEVAKEKTKVA